MAELRGVKFLGNPCKRNHSGIRYKIGGKCVECSTERSSIPEIKKRKAEYSIQWQKDNPQAHINWRAANRERTMVMKAKERARDFSVPFDITYEDVDIPTHCPVFNTLLRWDGKHNDKPSLDRIVPELGYVKDNVRVISLRANRLKNNMTKADVLRLLAYIEECSG